MIVTTVSKLLVNTIPPGTRGMIEDVDADDLTDTYYVDFGDFGYGWVGHNQVERCPPERDPR
jgi:hypothetical protein